MIRARLKVVGWPRRVLAVVDTPRPDCPLCLGEGGYQYDYGNPETGEYEGTDYDYCSCSTSRRWTLLPLPPRPRWLRRRHDDLDPWGTGYSDEPPY
ncbi:hypothetical protein [Streptomyces sp. NPDC094437]|uniref:hypothetical protein n=1 Tax=Streptomyces sp. NPDC094437 TaxID=3366060 RepID=UPI003823059E